MSAKALDDERLTRSNRRKAESRIPSEPRSTFGAWGNIVLLIGIAVLVLAFLVPAPELDFETLRSGGSKTALILTAHPDDEVMFFTPTILALVAAGWEVSGLCLSSGNGDGLGMTRTKELFRAYERLGVNASRVNVVEDPRLQDGMEQHWASSYVSQVLDDHLQHHPASVIITFDPVGITYHPNHIALAHGCSFGPRRSPGQCYALQSPSLLFKFTGPLWAILHNLSHHMRQITGFDKLEQASIKQKMTIVNSPLGWIRGAKAMAEHKSQLVWFRYLYFTASRLVWHNELEELLEHG